MNQLNKFGNCLKHICMTIIQNIWWLVSAFGSFIYKTFILQFVAVIVLVYDIIIWLVTLVARLILSIRKTVLRVHDAEGSASLKHEQWYVLLGNYFYAKPQTVNEALIKLKQLSEFGFLVVAIILLVFLPSILSNNKYLPDSIEQLKTISVSNIHFQNTHTRNGIGYRVLFNTANKQEIGTKALGPCDNFTQLQKQSLSNGNLKIWYYNNRIFQIKHLDNSSKVIENPQLKRDSTNSNLTECTISNTISYIHGSKNFYINLIALSIVFSVVMLLLNWFIANRLNDRFYPKQYLNSNTISCYILSTAGMFLVSLGILCVVMPFWLTIFNF